MKKILVIISLLLLLQWWFTDPTVTVPTNNISFNYIVKYNADKGDDDKLPMLVALHGNGDTTDNFYATALNGLQEPVRIILLEGPLNMGTGFAWPWTLEDYNKYGKAITEAIEILALKYPTYEKPILFGFSGGGSMAYYQAIKYGNRYSFIFPVSGNLSTKLLDDNKVQTGAPVFAYHGTKDQVLAISGGRQAVETLQNKGVKIKMTEFDGGHLGVFKGMKSTISAEIDRKLFSLTY